MKCSQANEALKRSAMSISLALGCLSKHLFGQQHQTLRRVGLCCLRGLRLHGVEAVIFAFVSSLDMFFITTKKSLIFFTSTSGMMAQNIPSKWMDTETRSCLVERLHCTCGLYILHAVICVACTTCGARGEEVAIVRCSSLSIWEEVIEDD